MYSDREGKVKKTVYFTREAWIIVERRAQKANQIDNIYEEDIVKLKQEYDDLCLIINRYLLKPQSTKV